MSDRMDDKATIATLTRQLEAVKGIISDIFKEDRLDVHVGYDDGPGGGNFVYAEAVRIDSEALRKASEFLATLSPTPAEKPEAVETGEPVAWVYEQLATKSNGETGWYLPRLSFARPDLPAGHVRNLTPLYPPAPTPPTPDDAWTRALHEAARIVDEWPEDYPGVAKHSEQYFAMLDRDIAIVKAISALALPQTAGDAT